MARRKIFSLVKYCLVIMLRVSFDWTFSSFFCPVYKRLNKKLALFVVCERRQCLKTIQKRNADEYEIIKAVGGDQ